MSRKTNLVLSCLFFACLAADLWALHHQIAWLHYAAKSLLMPLLISILLFTKALSAYTQKKYIVAALLFSWLGDCALLRGEQPLFFIIGLIGFLIAHIFYILYFHRIAHAVKGVGISVNTLVLLLVGIYAIGLYVFLLPTLGGMKIPVAIYTVVICLMLLKAISTKGMVKAETYGLFVLGALCFVLSDSVLAINRFAHPFEASSFVIMVTYGLAQWLLVQGTLKQGVS